MDSTLENSTSDGEWTLVVSRKERRQAKSTKVQPWKRNDVKPKKHQEERTKSKPRNKVAEEKYQPWKPKERKVNLERRARLIQDMKRWIWQTKRSDLYTTIFQQIKSAKLLERIRLVLGTEKQLQMVIYGLGDFEEVHVDEYGSWRYESRIQLSIALLMKREFNWIGEIQVFDPVLSATECSVLRYFGCTVLYINEHARREALKPTLFFMPHCGFDLYNNLLQENRRTNRLSKMAVLGNSFENHSNIDTTGLQTSIREFAIGHEYVIEKIGEEIGEKEAFSYRTAFSRVSWHFFQP